MKKWKWWHIVALILEIIGLTFLVLTLTTNLNDDLFLPVSLFTVATANILLLIMNIKQYRNKQK